jgi:hypothetical protein
VRNGAADVPLLGGFALVNVGYHPAERDRDRCRYREYGSGSDDDPYPQVRHFL